MFGYKKTEYKGITTFSFQHNEMKQWMVDHYNKYNWFYFDGILPEDIICMPINRKNIKFLGCANNNPYRIRLNFRYDLPEIEWQNVLLHEMVHIWQFVMEYKDVHGISFKKKAKELNKYGWNITKYHKNIIEKLKDVR